MRARFGRGTGGVAPKRAEPEAGRPEAGATKSRPQTFTSRLSCVGHQGRVALAFSEAHRGKTDKAARKNGDFEDSGFGTSFEKKRNGLAEVVPKVGAFGFVESNKLRVFGFREGRDASEFARSAIAHF